MRGFTVALRLQLRLAAACMPHIIRRSWPARKVLQAVREALGEAGRDQAGLFIRANEVTVGT